MTTQPTGYPYQAWYQASHKRRYLITNGEDVQGRALRYNEWLTAPISADEAATVLAGWKAEIAERDALRAEAAEGRRAYVRFGALPEGGRSYNRIDNHPEAGVSVYVHLEPGHQLSPPMAVARCGASLPGVTDDTGTRCSKPTMS